MYSVAMEEGADLELVCSCGYENFERVVVRRPGRAPYATDFVSCINCRTMFHAPLDTRQAEFDYDKSFGPARRRGQNSI